MRNAKKDLGMNIPRASGLAILGLVFICMAAALSGFGTVRGMGQDAEHGRITRHALGCESSTAPINCFQPDTLDSLAGSRGDFGAVGAPDRGRGMLTSFAHCSGGDYFDVPEYPHTQEEAQATLTECRNYMRENLLHAVIDAAELLDDDGDIRSSQLPGIISCIYAGSEHGRAKCNVLAHLGRILHAGQDFYSHSNWVDQADPSEPISAENPPGLGRTGRAAWLDLRTEDPDFPEGLISGCFDNESFLGEERGCIYSESGAHRVRHLDLNKDTGQIDPEIANPTTRRGMIGNNFERAVIAAIEDSAHQWQTFQHALESEYGSARAELMICAITHDDPTDDC
ncbi:hypothetical protein V0U79_01840 [Hyphobacterium sp. HN65]|uniref:VWA7 N-terminal domain-containing protein n=1 Tax=Hyphobacterium lacteum TaxID=3116575 RepID=A0ABU7LP23_9PROT|nr:hypothetical protein [Hyphobacterium sp. HN65]MEE2525089.1 hypothetical protein [Hyphobacterium sp. HN65]